MRILCTGDMHLGRPPVCPAGTKEETLSVAAVWQEMVTYACTKKVDSVLLTGDASDWDNRFFEAFAPFEKGLTRLEEAGIELYPVSGNPDAAILPRFAEAMPSERFHLLGGDGTWQRRALPTEAAPEVYVDAWSFPLNRHHVQQSPLQDYSPREDTELPVIGLLHADVDQPGSPYAPVSLQEMRVLPVDLWLLGHVHRPVMYTADKAATVLYPGSPQPLDPTETGLHGPWLVEVESKRDIRITHIPLASLCYEDIDVDTTNVCSVGDLETALAARLRERLTALTERLPALRVLGGKGVLVGRTPLYGELDRFASAAAGLVVTQDGRKASVLEVLNRARPCFDLQELAKGHDPAGCLAQVVLDLQSAGGGYTEETETLLNAVTAKMSDVYESNAYLPLHGGQADVSYRPDRERAKEKIIQQGMLLLDRLLEQNGREQG